MNPHFRRYKDALFNEVARIGKAISSPRRLELLDMLSQRPFTVEDLASLVGQSLANTSHHLRALHAARLVETERDGVFIRYCLAPGTAEFYRSLRELGRSRFAEVELLRRQFRAEFAVDDALILDGARIGERPRLLLLDVRPAEEYAHAHVSDAISMPMQTLDKRFGELPTDQDIGVYCRGPFCVLGLRAVALLRQKGYHAFLIEESVKDLLADGE